MKSAEPPDQFSAQSVGKYVYGEPFQTPDGTTVVTVARVRGGSGGRHPILARAAGVTVSPVGVFVFRDNDVTWVPAVDANRIAMIGVFTGLLAAVIGTLAVFRRPPWPDLSLPASGAPRR